ncbi:MAG TPA: exodeoxyribonuclease VII large subunit [Acidimicrobiales bacterium]
MQPSFDEPSFWEADDAGEPTYSVRELADAVNITLRRGFRDGVWVRGEIEGLQGRNGHVYFTLAERTDAGRATIPAALFANRLNLLRPMLNKHRLRLRDGLQVRVHGYLDLYAPSGRLSLVVDGLDPMFTLGQLAADRDELLRRLAAAGLLERNKALTVPAAPLRIGVVTSDGSAAWHDLTHELAASGLAFQVVLADVRVQGDGAERYIVAGIQSVGRRMVDVIAVVRGGGARSDLATFDTEAVARAIAAAPVPVFTGLGHEIDRSVADEVAHTCFKTPTALAAHLVSRVRAHQSRADQSWGHIARHALDRLERADRDLVTTARRLSARSATVLGLADQRVAHRAAQVVRSAVAVPAARERDLDMMAAQVHALDPARTLARGFSVTRTAAGRLVRDATDVAPGEVLVTTLASGAVRSTVEESTP